MSDYREMETQFICQTILAKARLMSIYYYFKHPICVREKLSYAMCNLINRSNEPGPQGLGFIFIYKVIIIKKVIMINHNKHLFIYLLIYNILYLYTIIRAVRPSTCNVRNAFDHLRYVSKVFFSTIPIPPMA